MSPVLSIARVVLLLVCICGDSPLLARKTKRQGKVRSILRECEDQNVEGEDCDFLRGHSALWRELSSMRQQIRKLRNVPEPPKDNQLQVEQNRLKALQLEIKLTENTEHTMALDRDITVLQGQDDKVMASLRQLTEVDNLETSRQISELRQEKEELRRHVESLVQTMEDRIQHQINRLQELDRVVTERVDVIETDNLTQIHEKIEGLISENLEIKESVRKQFHRQKNYVDREVKVLQGNLNNTIDLVNDHDKAQDIVNSKTGEDIEELYKNTFNLSKEITSVEQNMSEQTGIIHERINTVRADLTETNDTMYDMDRDNRIHHGEIKQSIKILENITKDTDQTIEQLKQNITSQHADITELIEGLTDSHEQMNTSFLDFQLEQDLNFKAAHVEIDSLRFGKEYVNTTLLDIIHTHKVHYNQTVSEIQHIRTVNLKQSQNLEDLKISETAERQSMLLQIEDLKANDSTIYSELERIQTVEDAKQNMTWAMIKALQTTDMDIYSSLNVIHTHLAGPYMMFTSYPSKHILNYDTGDSLVFDETVLNHGGYYDADNGWFECPVHGLYQCFLSVWGDFDERAQVELVMDKTVIMKAAAQPVAEARQHGSNQAVFECHRGQRVWLRGGTFGVLYTDEYRQNSFTGILLHNLENFNTDSGESEK